MLKEGKVVMFAPNCHLKSGATGTWRLDIDISQHKYLVVHICISNLSSPGHSWEGWYFGGWDLTWNTRHISVLSLRTFESTQRPQQVGLHVRQARRAWHRYPACKLNLGWAWPSPTCSCAERDSSEKHEKAQLCSITWVFIVFCLSKQYTSIITRAKYRCANTF